MTFKGPAGYGRIMNIFMNVAMGIAFSIFMLLVMQARVSAQAGHPVVLLTPIGFTLSFIQSFCIGFVVADLVPLWRAGSRVARPIKNKVGKYLVTVLIVDLIITTIIGFFMTFLNTIETAGFVGFFMSWISTLPLMLLVGYIVQLVIMKPIMALATRITGFDPEMSHPRSGRN